jgi:hypothetical protein
MTKKTRAGRMGVLEGCEWTVYACYIDKECGGREECSDFDVAAARVFEFRPPVAPRHRTEKSLIPLLVEKQYLRVEAEIQQSVECVLDVANVCGSAADDGIHERRLFRNRPAGEA